MPAIAPVVSIFCRTQFEGFHYWPDAPEEFSYLKSKHRHMFHVEVYKMVSHDNRDIEFIQLKREVRNYCLQMFGNKPTTYSCEQMGLMIAEMFEATRVVVSEDGENGAIVDMPVPIDITLDDEGEIVPVKKHSYPFDSLPTTYAKFPVWFGIECEFEPMLKKPTLFFDLDATLASVRHAYKAAQANNLRIRHVHAGCCAHLDIKKTLSVTAMRELLDCCLRRNQYDLTLEIQPHQIETVLTQMDLVGRADIQICECNVVLNDRFMVAEVPKDWYTKEVNYETGIVTYRKDGVGSKALFDNPEYKNIQPLPKLFS